MTTLASLPCAQPGAPGLLGRAIVPAVLMLVVSCFAQLLGFGTAPAAADSPARLAPLPGSVLRGFQMGEHNWQPGHRGVDLAGDSGAVVRAAAAGTVSWVGNIAGVPMISVQHPDGRRTTHQPVTAVVSRDQPVTAGQQIGVLVAGHCPEQACLHWGVREGDRYLDPLTWLGGQGADIRLLPAGARPRQQPPPGSIEQDDAQAVSADGMPTPGPITSGFGSRVNPISGATEFHDGIDIGAACGTPVATPWAGTVKFVGSAGGYGVRVEIEHGQLDGKQLATSYSHLSGFGVRVGQQVAAGTLIGQVGTTGFSTGCHLHYSATLSGMSVDPRTVR